MVIDRLTSHFRGIKAKMNEYIFEYIYFPNIFFFFKRLNHQTIKRRQFSGERGRLVIYLSIWNMFLTSPRIFFT